jgi:hypothetical protein
MECVTYLFPDRLFYRQLTKVLRLELFAYYCGTGNLSVEVLGDKS